MKQVILLVCMLAAQNAAAYCEKYSAPYYRSKIQSGEMKEISGIVASRKNPGVYWVHNDSGADASIYAINANGEYLSKVYVEEVAAKDIEDISIGKCEAGENCLILADTGNNKGNRSKLQILTVPEPKLNLEEGFKSHNYYAKRTYFRYKDWYKYDSEAMAYNYQDGGIYLIRKDGGEKHSLFKLKRNPFQIEQAQYLCDLKGLKDSHVVTAMDLHRDKRAMLVRSYRPSNPWQDSAIYEFQYKNITDVCNVAPKLIESGQEGQGEAVAYRYSKPGIVHVSEGYAAKLFNIDCKE